MGEEVEVGVEKLEEGRLNILDEGGGEEEEETKEKKKNGKKDLEL